MRIIVPEARLLGGEIPSGVSGKRALKILIQTTMLRKCRGAQGENTCSCASETCSLVSDVFGLMLVHLSETLTCHEMWLLCVILCLLVSCYLLPALKLSHHSTNAKELPMPQCCNPNNQGEVCHGRKVIGSLLGQLEAGKA